MPVRAAKIDYCRIANTFSERCSIVLVNVPSLDISISSPKALLFIRKLNAPVALVTLTLAVRSRLATWAGHYEMMDCSQDTAPAPAAGGD
jgi:hypothetical protein